MRGDADHEARHSGGMIFCAEYGLHFAKDGDHWRCIEQPDLVMLSGPERYRVGGLTLGSLYEAMRHLRVRRGIRPETGEQRLAVAASADPRCYRRRSCSPIDPLPLGDEPNDPLRLLHPAKSVGPPPRTASGIRCTNVQGLRAPQGERRREHQHIVGAVGESQRWAHRVSLGEFSRSRTKRGDAGQGSAA